jgi:hypothetical protein
MIKLLESPLVTNSRGASASAFAKSIALVPNTGTLANGLA